MATILFKNIQNKYDVYLFHEKVMRILMRTHN